MAQRVDLDAVEVEVDEVVRNVLTSLFGVSKLEGEVRAQPCHGVVKLGCD